MVMKSDIHISFTVHLLLLISIDLIAAAHIHGNPADELVDMINKNRSAHIKSSMSSSSLSSPSPSPSPSPSQLYANPGLGCMALQYIEAYNGKCEGGGGGGGGTEPPEVDITEVFAPDCGVELATVQTISGRMVACQLHYAEPPQAFSQLLIKSKRRLSILYDGRHTEVGVGVSGSGSGSGSGGGPYFWCVLFGSGETNSTFELEGGKALKQSEGCFSGTSLPCAAIASTSTLPSFFLQFILLLLLLLATPLS